MTNLVLNLIDVSKSYPGVRALDHVSLDCRAGEVHAILGENGSGKSTLMKIASGVVRPDSGVIQIGGTALVTSDPRLAHRLGLSTVYQDDSLVLELTVAQNLILAMPAGIVPFGRIRAWAERQLEQHGVDIPASALIGDLPPAQRQFVEIVKALLSNPKVLLLDEPTATLDIDGVRKLAGIIRDLAERGTGVIYVSHRLPEILDLADRVSILRDGVHRGTFDVTSDVSEHDLVSLMVGRDVASEYLAKPATRSDRPMLTVQGLSGHAFQGVSFIANVGEILGFAGAEGNGQREALRALVGLEEASGSVHCAGALVDTASPRTALAGGVMFLSSDRKGEAIFPDLSVQKNMVVSLLDRFSWRGLMSRLSEQSYAQGMEREFGVVASGLDTPIIGLSGGNQQKAALARAFRTGARAILIDEPTQGVDAGARFDIYKAIRENIHDDATCVVNSSDAQELAGICDRVLVFSRGRIVRELTGNDVNEQQIVSSFLTVRDAKAKTDVSQTAGLADTFSKALGLLANGSATWWVPLIFLSALTMLVAFYAAHNSAVFLKPINIRHLLLALAPVGIVAMAQLHVLLVRGLDVSVGSLMSLTVVVASFVMGDDAGAAMIVVGVLLCLSLGVAVGLMNGSVIRFGGINAIITTIAMLSILQGFALVGRPIPGGLISEQFASILRTRIGFLPVSALFLIAIAILGDVWLHRTRSGLEAKATGFREEAARRNGVPVIWVQLRAYILAAGMAALAGLFLGSEVGVGHPTVGQNYALSSIAASVLGGAALSGGRGSFGGALFGAFFFTLMVNVISILGLSSAVGVIASGVMTLVAIFLYSGLTEFERLIKSVVRPAARQSPMPAE